MQMNSQELENGRLFRILSKINTIVERPEHNLDPTWSETGDRFLIKLFRDYVFHQVTESGKPWMDMAHIVQCLNKLDAGVSEKVQLVSRDGNNLIVVSYGDLRRIGVPRDGLQRIEYYALCCSSPLIVTLYAYEVLVEVFFLTLKCSHSGAAGMDSMYSTSALCYEWLSLSVHIFVGCWWQ
ncbi:hypothetical protein TELCIR_01495 [Teladorsagia circumcincta]|uniref:Pan3 C-terminal knob domain-containing protein n=1 Tax=Teladorsagia circumcincta TaxID=45464 RepID=A0A2G9V1Q8_TELCI|nr:hypothetical protein TELCIR_01495 [Teladorsagia circumcincta]